MKFIVKMYLSSDEVEYYLAAGDGTTPNRHEAFVFDSEVIKYNQKINFKTWLNKERVRVIPVGDL